MENNNMVGLVLGYLDKTYHIKENRFLTKYKDKHEWGYFISSSLQDIFCLDADLSKTTLTYWAYNNGISCEEELKECWGWEPISITAGTHPIRVEWTREMANDLQYQFCIDVATEMEQVLANEMAREIDNQIIEYLRTQYNAVCVRE